MEDLYTGHLDENIYDIEQEMLVQTTRNQIFFCNHCSLYHNQLEDLEYVSRCNVCGRELEIE